MASIIYRIKASTLIEALVALVIISLSFSISMMAYTHLRKDYSSLVKLKAGFIINNCLFNERSNTSGSLTASDDITIQQTQSTYKNYVDLKLITYSAYNSSGDLILERKIIRRVNSDDKN